MAWCSSCGTELADGMAFCPACGTKSVTPGAAPVTPVAPTRQAPPAHARGGGHTACPNCGSFTRVKKSSVAGLGQAAMVVGLVPAAIGIFQIISFQSKGLLEQAAYGLAGIDPTAQAGGLIGIGALIAVVGLVLSIAGRASGAEVCTNCGYRFH